MSSANIKTVENFVNFVNSEKNVVPKNLVDDYAALSLKKTEDRNEGYCVFILTRGKNKGEKCGKKNVSGKDTCKTHAKKGAPKKVPEKLEKQNGGKQVEQRCIFVLTKGKSKGKKCSKKTVENFDFCRSHFEIMEDEKEDKTLGVSKDNEYAFNENDEEVEETEEVEEIEYPEEVEEIEEADDEYEKVEEIKEPPIEVHEEYGELLVVEEEL